MQAQTTATTKRGPGRPATRAAEDQSPFERWIAASGKTKEEVREALGWSRTTFYGALAGRHTPSLEHAVQVEDLTGGAVPARALLLRGPDK